MALTRESYSVGSFSRMMYESLFVPPAHPARLLWVNQAWQGQVNCLPGSGLLRQRTFLGHIARVLGGTGLGLSLGLRFRRIDYLDDVPDEVRQGFVEFELGLVVVHSLLLLLCFKLEVSNV